MFILVGIFSSFDTKNTFQNFRRVFLKHPVHSWASNYNQSLHIELSKKFVKNLNKLITYQNNLSQSSERRYINRNFVVSNILRRENNYY